MLRESGVVDAGGYGLVLILAGVVAGLRGDGDAVPEVAHHEPPRLSRPHHEDSRFRYCTNFIVSGSGLGSRELPAAARGARRLGPGRRRRGDAQGPRPHRRARGRGRALRGRRRGHQPRRRRHARADRRARAPGSRRRPHAGRSRSPPARASSASSPSSAPTSSPAARRSTPRPTSCWPASTRSPAEEVARPAQLLERDHGRRARLRAVREAGAGGPGDLAAGEPAGAGRARPRGVARPRTPSGSRRRSTAIATGGVAPAARDDAQGRFRKGDAVGFADEEIVAWGGAGSTLATTIESLARRGRDRHRDRRRGGADPARRRSTPTSPTGSRSRPTRAGSRAGGGCSPPSSAASFAGASELTPAQLRDAPLSTGLVRASSTSRSARSRASARNSPRRRGRRRASRPSATCLMRFPHSHRDRTVVARGRARARRQRRRSRSRCSATPRARFRRRGLSITSVKVGDESGLPGRPGSTSRGWRRSWSQAPGCC